MQDKKHKTFFQYHVPFRPKEDYKKYHVYLGLYFWGDGNEFIAETERLLSIEEWLEIYKKNKEDDLEVLGIEKKNKWDKTVILLDTNWKILERLNERPVLKYRYITEEQEEIVDSLKGAIGDCNGDATILIFDEVFKRNRELNINYAQMYSDLEYRHSCKGVSFCFLTSITTEFCSFYTFKQLKERDCTWFTHHKLNLNPTIEDLEDDVLNTCASLPYDEIELFFEHHFTWFEGDSTEFLDYAEKLFFERGSSKFIGGEQKYYLIIANWIKKKRAESNYLESIANTVICKEDITPQQTLSIEPSDQVEGSEPKPELTQREIALIYWYDRDSLGIDLNSSQQIAEENGYQSPTSGRSLYNDHYTKVRDKAEERTDNATSEKYLNNIMPKLTTERGKREANEDLKKARDKKVKKKKGLFY